MRTAHWTLGIAALLLPTSLALQVTPNSECAALCSDGSNSTLGDAGATNTNSSDVVCQDDEYTKSGKGIRFKNCLNCLQKSTDAWKQESDVFWFLRKYITIWVRVESLLTVVFCRQCPICLRCLPLFLPRCSQLGHHQLPLQH